MTREQMEKTHEVIRENEWVKNLVNQDLESGKDWDLVMEQVARAFKII